MKNDASIRTKYMLFPSQPYALWVSHDGVPIDFIKMAMWWVYPFLWYTCIELIYSMISQNWLLLVIIGLGDEETN